MLCLSAHCFTAVLLTRCRHVELLIQELVVLVQRSEEYSGFIVSLLFCCCVSLLTHCRHVELLIQELVVLLQRSEEYISGTHSSHCSAVNASPLFCYCADLCVFAGMLSY
jgi:hypothetical protein